jgi:hypothetical protein
MYGFLLMLLVGIPLYFLLQPPQQTDYARKHFIPDRYQLDLEKIGFKETGEHVD